MNPIKKPSSPAGPGHSGGSFLPTDYIEKRQTSRISFIGVGLLIVVMTGVIGAFLVTARHRAAVRAQQDAITLEYTQEAKKIEQLKKLEAQRKEMMAKAEVTAALIEKVPRSILLAELIMRMPRNITLLELELKGKRIENKAPPPAPEKGKAAAKKPAQVKSLSNVVKGGDEGAAEGPKVAAPRFEFTLLLTGVASVNNDIAEYLGQLQACALFGTVDLQYIKETVIDDRSLRRFEIVATIKNSADAHDLVNLKPQEADAELGDEGAVAEGEGADPAPSDTSGQPAAPAQTAAPDPAAEPAKEGQ